MSKISNNPEKEVRELAGYLGTNGGEMWSELCPIFNQIRIDVIDDYIKVLKENGGEPTPSLLAFQNGQREGFEKRHKRKAE